MNNMYESWLNSEVIDVGTKNEILNMTKEEREDAFCRDLQFGTAGLRGLMGAGTDRMNIYTLKRVAIAIAKWILSKDKSSPSIVIGYDVRHHSKEFAIELAKIMKSFGIKYYLFDEIVATPELSYSINKLHTTAGAMITASHNPRDYNGCKVYKSSGSQILNDDADIIQGFISNTSFEALNDYDDEAPDYFHGADLLEDYVNDVLSLSLYNEESPNIKLVYSPCNGCGLRSVEKVFKRKGYEYRIPEEQKFPDPDFKSIPYPNPEVEDTFLLSKKLAKETDADLIIATDPDSDRMNICLSDGDEYRFMTGNQVGALLVYYICHMRERMHMPHGVIIKTIVTDNFGRDIAESFGHEVRETLTGFKNIAGEAIAAGSDRFIFGYEESIGYEIGSLVRDKDGISASLFIADMAQYFKSKGKTLFMVLNELYERYGYYAENNFSIYYDGAGASETMRSVIQRLRSVRIDEIGGVRVKNIIDYTKASDEKLRTNAIKYILEDNTVIMLRPSGTEPKLKAYIYAVNKDREKALSNTNTVALHIKRILSGE